MRTGAAGLVWSGPALILRVPRSLAGVGGCPREDSRAPAWRGREVIADDSALIERCLLNDQRAFRELIKRYERAVYSLARRMVDDEEDARDIAQEAFIRAFRSLESFERTRPFASWIFKITSNLCIDHYRRRRLAAVSLDAEDEDRGPRIEIADTRPRPDDDAVHSDEERRLQRLVRSLPTAYRVVILLRHQSDLSYDEIAHALGVPLGTVKARLHRAHHILRRKIEARGEAPRRADGSVT